MIGNWLYPKLALSLTLCSTIHEWPPYVASLYEEYYRVYDCEEKIIMPLCWPSRFIFWFLSVRTSQCEVHCVKHCSEAH